MRLKREITLNGTTYDVIDLDLDFDTSEIQITGGGWHTDCEMDLVIPYGTKQDFHLNQTVHVDFQSNNVVIDGQWNIVGFQLEPHSTIGNVTRLHLVEMYPEAYIK